MQVKVSSGVTKLLVGTVLYLSALMLLKHGLLTEPILQSWVIGGLVGLGYDHFANLAERSQDVETLILKLIAGAGLYGLWVYLVVAEHGDPSTLRTWIQTGLGSLILVVTAVPGKGINFFRQPVNGDST